MVNAPQIPAINAEKSSDFKTLFADGAYTWVNSASGTLIFFNDTFEPNLNPDGSINFKSIKRTFTVEIRITREMYKNIIGWMSGRLKAIEEYESNQIKDQ